ncbi:MAG: siderophore-interacting protein [Acidimicrobiia bacterium]
MTQTTDVETLPPPAALELEVVRREAVTPRMTRVRLTGPDLGEFRFVAGQDLMLAIPTADGSTINRRYTIRSHDAAARAVDVDVVVHGDGPGARWVVRAAPGERIAAFGPRGKIVPAATAAWHLFIGDESGLPAIAAMLEALPTTATAIAVVEVADAREEQPVDAVADATISWVHRGGVEPGLPDLLVGAVGATVLPDGPGHAYLAAEMGVVAALRAELASRGLSPDAMSPKAYWRRGTANAAHGEPMRERA